MSSEDKGLIRVNRAITLQEDGLIRWLLDHSDVDPELFNSQLSDVTVASKCNCGCPTIYFAYRGEPVTRKGEHLISDYLATVEGQEVGVMLFERDGYLSSLEVYSCAGADKPFGLPEIESLYPYEDLAQHRRQPPQ
ncbi:MAG TPA: hypothetical protein VK813_13115 [Edaphobacter sp.]|jgi:hypothetical protein|nr:hypothetical protein [Edaphobacter sp.]